MKAVNTFSRQFGYSVISASLLFTKMFAKYFTLSDQSQHVESIAMSKLESVKGRSSSQKLPQSFLGINSHE